MPAAPPPPPSGAPTPPDHAARQRIETDLERTLFVEAGAGSGKTAALVRRVVRLVETGAADLASVAAITFTEKAAVELRDRIRAALEQSVRDHERDDPATASRARAALSDLDGAAIGTLHAFARTLLALHPIEAGLPPRIEVLDEVTSGIEFEARWRRFQDQLFEDPALERTLLLSWTAGVRPDALRSLAVAFDENWDLVDARVPRSVADPPPVRPALRRALEALDAACAQREHCRSGTDKLAERLDQIADWTNRLRAIDDEVDAVSHLAGNGYPPRPSLKVGNCGQKDNWAVPKDDVVAAVQRAEQALDAALDTVRRACAERIASAIAAFTLGSAEERRRSGRLEFHDLLVLSRQLLTDPEHGPGVRTQLSSRFERLLIDEFQDTDPIQIDVAVRIAAADPGAAATGSAPWGQVAVAPGRLFLVGDPKQSIYRFRRADIGTFLATRHRLGGGGDGVVELTANFRSGRELIRWVNDTFAAMLASSDDEQREPGEDERRDEGDLDERDGGDGDRAGGEAGLGAGPGSARAAVRSQAPFVGLDPLRPDPPTGPSVSVLQRCAHPGSSSADDLREAEAADVAALVRAAVADGWAVEDSGRWRPARLGDIAILVPSRAPLPFLEDALDAAGVPYRAESSNLVYASRAVRDLLMVARAADDPTDHLSVVAALRTPLLGCGDDDLFRFRVERGGRWTYLAAQPATVPPDDPVRRGLGELARLHRARFWQTPSELLDDIARSRRAFELGFAEGRPRDVWRRLRFVIDQARAWGDATGGGLRGYLRWVDRQSGEGTRVSEAVLPESDDDAVRIMTIHAAKGLQFPVTVLAGLSTQPHGRYAPAEVVFPPDGSVGYRFGRDVVTREYEEWAPIDEQMALDERKRLLYVACTRARDHLVLSLCRKEPKGNRPPVATNAQLLVDSMADALDRLPDAVNPQAALPLAGEAHRGGGPPPFDHWRRERDAALGGAARPTTIAATALTVEGGPAADVPASLFDLLDRPADASGDDGVDPGLRKRPRDLDLPPWLKGRYGTAVGRAVHGVLQSVRLDEARPAELDAAVAAQCQAEAIPDRAGDVVALVAAALESPTVEEAARHAHWKEVYACTPTASGRLLEGYVDLLYRRADGLVVVDYKTAATIDAAEIDRRVDRYWVQGAAYAVALADATGEPIAQVTFAFLTPEGPVERHLSDVTAAMAEVRALLEGDELTILE